MMHIDPQTNKEITKKEAEEKSSLVGFCSWRRLHEVFRAAEEIRGREEIVAFDIDEQGIVIRIKRT